MIHLIWDIVCSINSNKKNNECTLANIWAARVAQFVAQTLKCAAILDFFILRSLFSLQPVCHYTLASIYLSLHDYVASTIHLRAALHAQPSFDHALSALKLIRCSMKFKEEKAQLKKKVQLFSVWVSWKASWIFMITGVPFLCMS